MTQAILTDLPALPDDVLSKEDQARLSPADVLRRLREGNDRFASGEVTLRNHLEQVRKAALAQFPMAVVLSCLDARVPVEDVFDCGLGDLFVARVAGNFVNTDILASMEFACKAAGSKLVLVLGHEYCGAVKGAIDKVELGHLPALFEKIEPAVKEALNAAPGTERTSDDAALVSAVVTHNVALTMQRIRDESEVLRRMEEAGEIVVVGGVYDMETGKVAFID